MKNLILSRPLFFVLLLVPLLVCGCNTPSTDNTKTASTSNTSTGDNSVSPLERTVDRSAGAFATADPWLLTTTDPQANRGNHGIFLGNGYLGATFGASGMGDEKSLCFVAGVYDAKENFAPIPNWNAFIFPANSPGDYTQTLDMKRGVLTTRTGERTVTAFLSATTPNLAVLHFVGVPQPATAPEPVSTQGVHITYTDKPDNDKKGWTRFVVVNRKGDSATVTSASLDWNARLAEQEGTWAKRWTADITIDGDPEAQQLVHKLLFDLMQSARPNGNDSIAPESLSGNFYKGHIFWDADIWMFPALLAQHPEMAKNILDYRFRHLEAARQIAKSKGFAGADFPWESAASGKETAPGGFSEGRHVTAGVGWSHWQYYLATQDKKWLRERGFPVLSAVADYFASRAIKNPTTGKYDINKVFGPDELKGLVNNNTYTNAMARKCLLAAGEAAKIVGIPANPKWATVASGIALPFDTAKHRYLTRADDDGSKTKQADGELVLYPANLPMDKATAQATFDFQAKRPIKNGPAMTASIHALLAARLGETSAESYFRDSYRPFVRGPFLLFSEKRSLDRCVFTTGAGGIVQSILYGFGGLDFAHFDTAPKTAPVLPASWKKLAITGIRHGAKTYTVEVSPQGRVLTGVDK